MIINTPYIMRVAAMAFIPYSKELYIESKKNVTDKTSDKILGIVEQVLNEDGLKIPDINKSQFIQHHRRQELKREYDHNNPNYSDLNRIIGDGRLHNRNNKLDRSLTKAIDEIDNEQILLLTKKI